MDICTSESEDEYDGGTISEFEGSDDSMQGDDTLFDPEAISDIESDASTGDESIETLSACSSPPASPTTQTDFTLLSDPFSDTRPNPLPTCNTDFPDVHPSIILHHEASAMSALDCFQLFMGKDVVAALCLWTNTRAAYFFRDHPNISPKKFMGKKWSDVSEEEMYVYRVFVRRS